MGSRMEEWVHMMKCVEVRMHTEEQVGGENLLAQVEGRVLVKRERG